MRGIPDNIFYNIAAKKTNSIEIHQKNSLIAVITTNI